MSRVKDETGKRYGRLVVIERAGSTSNGIALWKCKCDCGNEVVVQGAHLRSGHTVSCGCKGLEIAGHNFQDLTGQRFGMLTVIKRVKNINKQVAYECKCDCGKTIVTLGKYLKFNHKSSCGCQRRSNGEILIEQLLIDNNINYETEKTFSDLVSIKDGITPYRYDFYLPEYNRIIEFDGLQHTSNKADQYFDRTHKELEEIDNIKNQYAKTHNITIIRIPYNKLQSLVINDLLDSKFEI